MTLALFIILAIVIALTITKINFVEKTKSGYSETESLSKSGIKYIAFIAFAILIILIQPFSFSRIDAGHTGIKANLIGQDRGVGKYEYVTGYVFYNSWFEQVFEFPIYQQHIDYPEQVVITKGGFQTTIKPSFNYNLISGNIGDMFVNLRVPLKQIEQQWLLTAIISSVNDIANTWTVDDIFNNREKFESAIMMEAKKRTGKWFNLSQLRTNINPPDALKQSILAKTRAVQEVQVAQMSMKVAVAEAETNVAKATGLANAKIAAARGDSASMIINAIAEAKAIQLKQQQINSNYIEFIKWGNWNGVLPSTILGNNGATLYNLK